MLNKAQGGEWRVSDSLWPFALKSSLVDTEHLPKVRNTVTPVTSLILQGQGRTIGSELGLVSDPWLEEVPENRGNSCQQKLTTSADTTVLLSGPSQPVIKQFLVYVFLPSFSQVPPKWWSIPSSQWNHLWSLMSGSGKGTLITMMCLCTIFGLSFVS